MSQVQIQKMSPRHDAIMEWLIANPQQSQGACARHFGVTQSWMSIIINSDAFQERYKELLGDYHDQRIIPLRDKLHGIAHRAVEKLATDLEASTEPSFHLDVADKMLSRLGYGKQTGPSVVLNSTTNNLAVVTSASKEDLARARERMRKTQELLIEGIAQPVLEARAEAPPLQTPTLPGDGASDGDS